MPWLRSGSHEVIPNLVIAPVNFFWPFFLPLLEPIGTQQQVARHKKKNKKDLTKRKGPTLSYSLIFVVDANSTVVSKGQDRPLMSCVIMSLREQSRAGKCLKL